MSITIDAVIANARRKKPRGREFQWRCDPKTYKRARVVLEKLHQLPILSPEAVVLREEARKLPGFPQDATERDTIWIEQVKPTTTVGKKVN